ncbi:MAG: hypothetical protein C0513_08120 [Isosphaera sp.]|nr:hypothetical protein [Isosphaera sp.]
MKILHYLRSLDPAIGGVVQVVMDTCALLAGAGHRVTLATTDPHGHDQPAGPSDPSPLHGKLRVVAVPPVRTNMRSLNKAQRDQVSGLLRDAEVVHIHGMWERSPWQVARLGLRAGARLVVNPHGMLDCAPMRDGWLKKRVFLRLYSAPVLARASAVVCASDEELAQSRPWLRPGVGRVIPFPIPLGAAAESPADAPTPDPTPHEQRPVVFLGRVHPIKRIETLIDAMGRPGSGWRLCVAGPEEDAAYAAWLRRRAASAGVSARIEWAGMVSGAAKAALLRSALCLALPSLHENFGAVIFEALAHGAPVIVGTGVLLWGQIHAADAGLVAQAGAHSWSEAIESLRRSAERRDELAQRGVAWARAMCDPATLAAAWHECYAAQPAGSSATRA